MTPHFSTLAWKIPWMEERGGLQSMGSRRVGHDWGLHFHFLLLCIGEGNGNPLQCCCLENPRDGGAWWVAVYGVAQSRTRLKWLSSSSSRVASETLSWTSIMSFIIIHFTFFLTFRLLHFKSYWGHSNGQDRQGSGTSQNCYCAKEDGKLPSSCIEM